MGLTELLEKIRDNYLRQLRIVIKEKRALPGHRLITEPALRAQDGELALDGELQLPARTDMAVLQGGDLSELLNVEGDELLEFDPVEFDWANTLHVEMGPFAWQSFLLTLPGDSPYDWAPMSKWFWKWFLEEEDELESPHLLGAVHFLSDPIVDGDVVEFGVDLGSAPVAAFEQLLDALAAAGVTLCAIGDVLGEDDEVES